MCLLNYKYLTLHPAFLAFRSVIRKQEDDVQLLKHLKNVSLYIAKEIIPAYEIIFGKNENCLV